MQNFFLPTKEESSPLALTCLAAGAVTQANEAWQAYQYPRESLGNLMKVLPSQSAQVFTIGSGAVEISLSRTSPGDAGNYCKSVFETAFDHVWLLQVPSSSNVCVLSQRSEDGWAWRRAVCIPSPCRTPCHLPAVLIA